MGLEEAVTFELERTAVPDWPEVRVALLAEVVPVELEALALLLPLVRTVPVAACDEPEAVVLPLWRTVVDAVCVDPEEELRAVDPEAVDVDPEERTGVPELAVLVDPEERVVPEVVRTVVRPLLVTFELETVVSLRSTLALPDWEEPVVVVFAPEDAALMLVEEDRVEEEELRAVFCA